MTDHELLNHYTKLAKVLAEMFSPVLEVLVHDLRKPEQSIIAIYNSHITGREVGGGATDLGLRRLSDNSVPDVLVNYANEAPDGRPLKSSTVAIRNSDGILLGSICFNLDTSYFSQFSTFIQQFISAETNSILTGGEDFHAISPKQEIHEEINRILLERNWQTKRLSNDDKKQIVSELKRLGMFNKKAAVSTVAKELQLTRPTIYSYLKQ